MRNKEVIIGAVGIAIGFIAGFFTSEIRLQSSAVPPPQSATPSTSQLPENHPSPEMMDRIGQLRELAVANPEDVKSRVELGNAYYDMGRYDAAIPWYEEALTLDSQNVNLRTDLGTAYLYSGNPIKAVENYQRSLEIQPDHIQTLQNIGVAYMSTGNHEKALGYFEKLLELYPDTPARKQLEEQIEKIKDRLAGDGS